MCKCSRIPQFHLQPWKHRQTSCFLALLGQPGAHSLLLLCDLVSVGPSAARLCGAGCTIRCPQNEMGCFITSPSGSCLPGIHIPAKGDTWPSTCLTLRRCASGAGTVRKAVHHRTATLLLYRDTGGETRSILSGFKKWWKYARSALYPPSLIDTQSVKYSFNLHSLWSGHQGEQRPAESVEQHVVF